MGDRGNICIRYEDGGEIYFYTHWRGSAIKGILQSSLSKHWRWDDPPYLARIIFCDMIDGSEKEETGYGISPYVGDNSHPIVYVNTKDQTIQIGDNEPISYEDFINKDLSEED